MVLRRSEIERLHTPGVHLRSRMLESSPTSRSLASPRFGQSSSERWDQPSGQGEPDFSREGRQPRDRLSLTGQAAERRDGSPSHPPGFEFCYIPLPSLVPSLMSQCIPSLRSQRDCHQLRITTVPSTARVDRTKRHRALPINAVRDAPSPEVLLTARRPTCLTTQCHRYQRWQPRSQHHHQLHFQQKRSGRPRRKQLKKPCS